MKKLIPALFAAIILLPACGKIDTTLKSPKRSVNAATATGRLLTPAEFQSACTNEGGVLEVNNTMCRAITYQKALPGVSSSTTNDYTLTTIGSGTAVLTTGQVSNNSVQLFLNGSAVTTIPNTRPVTTNGGTLTFRLNPGNFQGVAVYVYTCYNQAMTTIRCPY